MDIKLESSKSSNVRFWILCSALVSAATVGAAAWRHATSESPNNGVAAAATPVAIAQAPASAPAPAPIFAGAMIEAEDFKPQGAGTQGASWKPVMNGQGNYMVDIIGFQHISGERLLSGDAGARDARAVATIDLPEAGDYRVWSRFEQPTGTDNRFRVEVRQGGKLVGQGVMGEKDAPKYFFGSNKPVGQADPSWGSEGLVEQAFDLKGAQAGPADVTLVAVEQPANSAHRNVDFLFFTRDLQDTWRSDAKYANLYRILDAAQQVLPTRYYLRLTAPQDVTASTRFSLSRIPWGAGGANVKLTANTPGEWLPLRNQDVTHYTTLSISGPAGKPFQIKAELSTTPDAKGLLRTI